MAWLRKRALLNKEVLMVSALVPKSNRSGFEPWGLLLEGPEKFSHPESRGIIANLMITELFNLRTLSITRSSLHTRYFSSIHRSVFKCRFTKMALPARKACGAFEKRAPGWGHCIVFLGKALCSHSASLHPSL